MINNPELHTENQQAPVANATDFGTAIRLLSQSIRSYFEHLRKYPADRSFPRLHRLEVRIPEIDPLLWLQQQDAETKIYWEDREHLYAMASIGAADVVTDEADLSIAALFARLHRRLTSADHPAVRYFGGLRFYAPSERDATWQHFGRYRFILPQFLLERHSDHTLFACNIFLDRPSNLREAETALLRQLDRLTFHKSTERVTVPDRETRHDLPDRVHWARAIETALAQFSRGDLHKVVLARKSVFSFARPLNPQFLLRRLKASNPQLFFFCFQPDAENAFIGGSPERLYRREGHQIKSEAIAGTRPRGFTVAEDERLGKELLQSEKDIREHRFVVDTILQTLNRLCQTVDMDDEISLLKLARVQHLCCRLQGVLADGVTDADLIQALHPTPAVGGSPTAKAIRLIRELEPFDRGWYAAPIGWIGQDAAEFVVGIRSGLVQGRRLSLFSGAGIVRGSTPEAEWQEIENKIANFMKILHTPC